MTNGRNISEAATSPEEHEAMVLRRVSQKGAPAKAGRHPHAPKPSTVIAVVVLVAGVGIIAYPTFSDWWNSYHQTRAIASYVQAVEDTNPAKIQKMLSDAEDYNRRLFEKSNRFDMTEAEKAEYESLLDLTGTGIMGYVQINCINVDYPIYHGMEENVLQIAIGHLEGTSLPVGGESTHSAISGHRGLPSAKLFTDLDKVVEGDTFTITVLDRTCTYEVDQIRIVLPEDLANLSIEPGSDYCTLITCTPYGVNTHRLLVRGHRVENLVDADVITAEALQIPRYIAIAAVGLPILFAFLAGMLVYYAVRRPAMSREEVEGVIRESIRDGEEDRIRR
ncbi:MAG: class C sortase [Eggerthellaceae bacterium]|nr:class C sortase [Eggerthellaceae bacterium]